MNVLSLHIGALGVDGGVAQVGLLSIDSFVGTHGGEPWDVEALSLLGERGQTTPASWDGKASYRSFGGSKVAFALAAVAAARRRPDLVFADHLHVAPVGLAAAALCRAGTAVFLHGVEVYGAVRPDGSFPPPPLTRLRRACLRRARVLCANSRWTAEQTLRVEPRAPRPAVASLAPRAMRFPECDRSGRPPTALMVARMSRFERYKGHEPVLRCWPRVLAAVPDATLRIVGGGDDREWLGTLAMSTGAGGAVQFLGRLPESELLAEYAAADVFVLPSWGEGFGLVYAEAAMAGLPSIAHRHGPAAEIVEDGETGWLVNAHRLDEVEQALVAALGDRERTRRMGAQARARVGERFTLTNFAAALRAAVEPCASPTGRGGRS